MKKIKNSSIWIIVFIFILIVGLIRLCNTSIENNIKDWMTQKDRTDQAEDRIDVKANIDKAYAERVRFDKCTSTIKDYLKYPLSFDHDAGTTTHQYNDKNGHYIVRFRFYADNGFHDSLYSEGACAFDEKGKLINHAILGL